MKKILLFAAILTSSQLLASEDHLGGRMPPECREGTMRACNEQKVIGQSSHLKVLAIASAMHRDPGAGGDGLTLTDIYFNFLLEDPSNLLGEYGYLGINARVQLCQFTSRCREKIISGRARFTRVRDQRKLEGEMYLQIAQDLVRGEEVWVTEVALDFPNGEEVLLSFE